MEYGEAFADLANVYLEDSWVLEIAPARTAIAFRLEAVLRPEHPQYAPPPPSEKYCYREVWLEVASAEAAEIDLSGAPPARDASGTDDLGNIDRFDSEPNGEGWALEGDWGRAKVRNPAVKLTFV